MSTSNSTTNDHSDARLWMHCKKGDGRCGNWSGLNIAAMVVGFVIFWPIGLFILYWILKGRSVRELPATIQYQWHRFTGKDGLRRDVRSDNDVFNHYQQTQYDRIHEIKEEIKVRSRRFRDFRTEAKRRADEEEFNRFMADAPGGSNS